MKKIIPLIIVIGLIWGCNPNKVDSGGSAPGTGTDWIYQVDSLVMPFWMTDDALGNPPGNFPAYRYPDGRAIDPADLDYSILVPEYRQYYMENSDSLRRDFIRVRSRQVYGYCIAYHLTGNGEYLKNARQGLDYLIDHGVYRDSSVVTFWDREGNPEPGILQRNAQDLAYGLLGPSIYYYLTRDPDILKIILEANRFVWEEYYERSDIKENTRLFAWVKEDFETDSARSRELLAPLDQLNAYTLLTALIVPDSLSAEFSRKVSILANSIKDNFYSEEYNLFWSSLNHKKIGGDTDFAHSIKTFWMLYVSAKLLDDKALEDFAYRGAEKLLNTAYLKDEGRWASTYLNESLELDKSLMAWHNCELDQMAATLSFRDTAFYTEYLLHTYPYFEQNMIDHVNKGTYWGRSADGKVIEVGFRSGWHMADFHDMEHALIGYLSTSNYYGEDIRLYFAFDKNVNPEKTIIRPYYYDAETKELKQAEFNDPVLSGLIRTRVIFNNIK